MGDRRDTAKNTMFSIREPRDAIGHEVGKPTPPEDTTFSVDGPRKAKGYDVGKPTHRHTTEYLAQMNVGMPSSATCKTDTVSRRLSSRRGQKTPYLVQVSVGMTLDTTLENLRQASRRNQQTKYLP
jgi:hypothetical protein